MVVGGLGFVFGDAETVQHLHRRDLGLVRISEYVGIGTIRFSPEKPCGGRDYWLPWGGTESKSSMAHHDRERSNRSHRSAHLCRFM